MISFEEFHAQRQAEREAEREARRKAAEQQTSNITEYLNSIQDKHDKEADYISYLLMKGHERDAEAAKAAADGQ